MFTIYPAVDLLNGQCVRLFQGDYERSTVYGDAPEAVASRFYDQGAEWLHVVDLDGAREGRPVNREAIARIVSEVPVSVEVGGGIRNMAAVENYLDLGVRRVILGSAAISDPVFTRQALARYPDAVAIGLDVKKGNVAVEGWLEVSDIGAADLARRLVDAGARTFIYTDISKDGALGGANIEGARQLAEAIGLPVVLSGGISTIDDVLEAAESGLISGAIIGKALYTNRLSLDHVLEAVKDHAR